MSFSESAAVVELADTTDLKSVGYRFESDRQYDSNFNTEVERVEKGFSSFLRVFCRGNMIDNITDIFGRCEGQCTPRDGL